MITILIADDQPAVRTGLRMRLALEEDLQVIGEAQDGAEAVALAARLRPHIVIMDLSMPGMDGLAATRKLQSILPDCRVLILSIHDDAVFRREARRAGARGFISKHGDDIVLLAAVRALANRGERND